MVSCTRDSVRDATCCAGCGSMRTCCGGSFSMRALEAIRGVGFDSAGDGTRWGSVGFNFIWKAMSGESFGSTFGCKACGAGGSAGGSCATGVSTTGVSFATGSTISTISRTGHEFCPIASTRSRILWRTPSGLPCPDSSGHSPRGGSWLTEVVVTSTCCHGISTLFGACTCCTDAGGGDTEGATCGAAIAGCWSTTLAAGSGCASAVVGTIAGGLGIGALPISTLCSAMGACGAVATSFSVFGTDVSSVSGVGLVVRGTVRSSLGRRMFAVGVTCRTGRGVANSSGFTTGALTNGTSVRSGRVTACGAGSIGLAGGASCGGSDCIPRETGGSTRSALGALTTGTTGPLRSSGDGDSVRGCFWVFRGAGMSTGVGPGSVVCAGRSCAPAGSASGSLVSGSDGSGRTFCGVGAVGGSDVTSPCACRGVLLVGAGFTSCEIAGAFTRGSATSADAGLAAGSTSCGTAIGDWSDAACSISMNWGKSLGCASCAGAFPSGTTAPPSGKPNGGIARIGPVLPNAATATENADPRPNSQRTVFNRLARSDASQS